MPTYTYACTECGEQLEVVQSLSDSPLVECPHCSGRLRKVFHPVGVMFKGSGFYRTDSRSSKESGGTAAGSKADKGDAAGAKKGSSGSASGDGKGSASGDGKGSASGTSGTGSSSGAGGSGSGSGSSTSGGSSSTGSTSGAKGSAAGTSS